MKKDVLQAPTFCQYEGGKCNKIKGDLEVQDSFWAYASRPTQISSQITNAIQLIRDQNVCSVIDWKDMAIRGRIVFCEICKSIRKCKVTAADITTLNDNVLFELGYAIGLGKKLWPIRDVSYKDKRMLELKWLLQYLGFTDFRNSSDLMTNFLKDAPWTSVETDHEIENHVYYSPELDKTSRLFYFKSLHNSDGSIQLTSLLKKSHLPIDTIDPDENSQLSMRDYSKRISTSLGVIVHLIDPQRDGAITHNSLCAFLAGIGLAMEKPTLILQEGEVERPIDFGEVIRPYTNAKTIPIIFDNWIQHAERNLERSKITQKKAPRDSGNCQQLEKLDLGDIAAENEIDHLGDYFVKTQLYQSVLQGKDFIVAGRKGTGKTALFYEIRRRYWSERRRSIVLDLKPEGYQLKLFADLLREKFAEGTKQYLIKSFWEYVVLTEIGRQVLKDDKFAFQTHEGAACYKEVEKSVNPLNLDLQGDFAQRLLNLVNYLAERLRGQSETLAPGLLTQHLHLNELKSLRVALSKYLRLKDGLVILIDNLDKDWKTREELSVEVSILRSLLDSLRVLANDFGRDSIETRHIVFIRNDILDLLYKATPDKDKDHIVSLVWTDHDSMKRILKERFDSSLGASKSFEESWSAHFAKSCAGIDSFSYMLSHTLMRPRDLLMFCKQAIDTAIGRRHGIVQEEDIIDAEKKYSSSMLNSLISEIRDVYGELEDCILEFLDEQLPIPSEKLEKMLQAGTKTKDATKTLEVKNLLLLYGFLGIETGTDEFSYITSCDYNLAKLLKRAEKFRRDGGPDAFTVHPAYRGALDIVQ